MFEYKSCTTMKMACIVPKAEYIGCKRQSLPHSKTEKGRSGVTSVRTCWLRNRNVVLLVTVPSFWIKFHPMVFLLAVYPFHLLSAHAASRKMLVTPFHHTFLFH